MSFSPTSSHSPAASSTYQTASTPGDANNDDSDDHYSSAEETPQLPFTEPEAELQSFHRLLDSLDHEHHHDASAHLYSAFLINKAQNKEAGDAEEEGEEQDEGRKKKGKKGLLIHPHWTAWPVRQEEVPRLDLADRDKGPGNVLREALADTFKRKARGRIAREKALLGPGEEVPEMESDDEEMEAEIQPLVTNLLKRVDMLLLGLHKERERYWRFALPDPESADDTSAAPSPTAEMRNWRCEPCAKSHQGCDGARPCQRCLDNSIADKCVDQPVVKIAGNKLQRCLRCHAMKVQCNYEHPCQRCSDAGLADEECVFLRESEKDRIARISKERAEKGKIINQEPSAKRRWRKEDEPDSEEEYGKTRKPKEKQRKIFKTKQTTREVYEANLRGINQKRLVNRDWSTVMGYAATQGWNNIPSGGFNKAKGEGGPVDRTVAKCSELFDEKMEMRTIKLPSRPDRERPSRPYLYPIQTPIQASDWGKVSEAEKAKNRERRRKLNELDGKVDARLQPGWRVRGEKHTKESGASVKDEENDDSAGEDADVE